MKQVLIIDESTLFREYLKAKLEENLVEVSTGINVMDGISKMRNLVPDLIIMDYHLGRQGFIEVLKQKKADPNTANIPIIMLAQHIDQKRLLELIPFNVKKVFTKPVKIDALYVTLSELLGMPFSLDESPGIVEAHINDSIIFIEIAQGLNRDKIDLLSFKITELIDLYEVRVPKVIIMLSDIKLGFGDAPNMQKLLSTVLQASRAKQRYVRVLTKDDFVRQFIKGRKEYSDIEVVTNLHYAMDGLLSELSGSTEYDDKSEIIGDKLLRAKTMDSGETVALKFDADVKNASFELVKDLVQNLKVAVVDDDFIIQEQIKNTFGKTGAIVSVFSDGEEFLKAVKSEEFDLVFLDINMPGKDGFEVLGVLQTRKVTFPVIALSGVVQRETMIKAYQMGVKSYLIKPMKPEDIFKKSIEILKANF